MLIGWPLRSLCGLARPWGEPGIGLEPGAVAEAARASHASDQHRCADLGEPGQGPGQLPGVGLPVVLFAGGGSMGGQLGLDGAQQPDLGGDLGGQFGIQHRRVAAIELDGGARGGAPLGRPLGARLVRRFGKGNEKKAAVAVAHTLICIAWTVMKNNQDYAEAGEDYYEQRDARNHDHLVRHHRKH